jgi:hypothetical protein
MKKNRSLEKLLKRPSFTSKEARALDIKATSLAYYAKTGVIERISHGVYRSPKVKSSAPFEWQDLHILEGVRDLDLS